MRLPLIGPRGRVKVLGETPTWVSQTMVNPETFTGNAPATATVAAEDLDPTITAGRAVYADLTEGGLFDILAKAGKAYVIEDISNAGNAALTIVRPGTSESRPFPADQLPVRCGPGECPKALNGVTATPVAFLVREEIPTR